MGIIRAAMSAVSGTLKDQWLDTVEPEEFGGETLCAPGVIVRQGSNKKRSSDVISDGSVIHVYDNQCMILTDGGKIIDYTAEPGYYTVDSGSSPSLFNGDLLSDVIGESFNRVKFGGGKPQSQRVFYINLQEIRGIRFGTKNPVNYFDAFYNAELFLRCHGSYSMKITDPIRFYTEVVPKDSGRMETEDLGEQFLNEFLEALQTSINQMSADGIRISYVTSKTRELSNYMADTLDKEWKQQRGIEIQSVGIASLSYDEESQKLIHMRNQGAMLQDPSIREGYIQGAVARGMEAAGSNGAGSMAGFMGMGMGMQAGGGFVSAASQANQAQIHGMQQAGQTAQQGGHQGQPFEADTKKQEWTCTCGSVNNGNFCPSCGRQRPATASWQCVCGSRNTGNFCTNCGKPRPQ